MTAAEGGLSRSERANVIGSGLIRAVSIPFTAAAGIAVTFLQLSYADTPTYAVVAIVSSLPLLFSFGDLGYGAPVMSAFSNWTSDRALGIATFASAFRRLMLVAAAIASAAVAVSLTGGWSALLGISVPNGQGWAVTLALCLFAVYIPSSLGARVLVGTGHNRVVATLPIVASAGSVAATLTTIGVGWPPMLLCASVPLGFAASALIGLALSARLVTSSGLRRVMSPSRLPKGLLRGSAAALVIAIGLPIGLQSGRLVLGHFGSDADVALFALAMQLYGVAWNVLSVAGAALWPIFVRRQHLRESTVRLWLAFTVIFGLIGILVACALLFGTPLFVDLVSSGELSATWLLGLGVGALIVAQALHLPSGMMLTLPNELRWQAICVAVMCVFSLGSTILVSPTFGAVGLTFALAGSIFICQFVPDLAWARVLVRRRERSKNAGDLHA